jgi:predicted pyridoxal phosphate-dependent acyltransferase
MEFPLVELDEIKKRGLYRQLKLIEGEQRPTVTINSRKVINLCSNNYLGLASHPQLKRAAQEAIEKYGCSAAASRLICGNMELHQRLEERIAHFKKTEAALLFNNGYMANLGVIPALTDKGDIILSDELNHASIIDGCRLSKAEVKVFPHKDMNVLEQLLKESQQFRRRLIITEGLFGMDGDLAPLPQIIELAARYSSLVMVDEAHTTGVLGREGRGSIEYFGLEDRVDIIMGTLGKALGSFGAYIAGSKELRDFLINRCRSFIFSTALPPSVLACSLAALKLIEKAPQLREALWGNTYLLKQGLKGLGFDIAGEAQIIPLIIGDAKLTMDISERLLEEGVFVQGIRPPTVPPGKSRLRITPIATHTKRDLEGTLVAFEKVGKELKII